MAKKSFKIPASLDVTYLDMYFNLKSKSGVGFQKPVSAKVVLLTIGSAFVWFYAVFNTFIKNGGVPIVVGFTIVWFIFSILMIKSDGTGRTGLELVLSMLNYLPKSGRYLPTRMSDQVQPFKALLNIDTIDPEDSLIHYLNGDIGHIYHIVGSASSLMFEEDKQAILNKVDAFYKKLPVGVEVIYDTIYEGHAVDEQIEAVKVDMRNLESQSPGLRALLTERHDILKHAINNNQGLTSLHQYLVVRAPKEVDLVEFENLLIGDVENDGLMFRLAKTLTYKEAQEYLKSIACGVGDIKKSKKGNRKG